MSYNYEIIKINNSSYKQNCLVIFLIVIFIKIELTQKKNIKTLFRKKKMAQ